MSGDRPSLAYRPHLDGLRALAVLLVFVFHANVAFLRGGFIGVDIFFVLSGYLITRVILSQAGSGGSFSFSRFYARRARRLLPAMFALVTVVALREAIWGSILDAATRAREVVATLLYVSNWNFILQSDDYFAAEGAASPLRHTWSLAVEEQFYILFPLILIGAVALGMRRKVLTPAILAILAFASYVAMVVLYAPGTVVRDYYGTDTRAHQLLIGALLGYLMYRWADVGRQPGPAMTRAARWAGPIALLAIVGLAFTMSGANPMYFRIGSVAVAAATITLILAIEIAPLSVTGRALSWGPAVGLGKVSYGFYLWHWPIILWIVAPLGAGFWERRMVNGVQFGLTLVVAAASYAFLESPIREQRGILKGLRPQRVVALGLSMSVILAIVFGYTLMPKTDAVAEADTSAFASGTSEPDGLAGDGSLLGSDGGQEAVGSADTRSNDEIAAAALADRSYEPCADNPRPCVKYEPSADPSIPTVALIGDSTAQAYDPALKLLAEQYGFRYVQAAVGGCPISHRLLATGEDGQLHKESNYMCWDELPGIYAEVLDRWDPELFIATSWNESNSHVSDGVLIEADTPEHHREVEAGLREVIEQLTSDARLAFIHILPPGPSITCLESDPPDGPRCNRTVSPSSREKGYNAIFDLIASEDPSVVSFGLEDLVCPDDNCPLMIDGLVIRYDGGHLTGTASRALAPIIATRLAALGVDLAELGASAD